MRGAGKQINWMSSPLVPLHLATKSLQKLKFYNTTTGNFFRLSQALAFDSLLTILSLAVAQRYIGNTFTIGRGIIHPKFTHKFSTRIPDDTNSTNINLFK